MSKVRIGELMQRRKESIRIEDDVTYKQVTIRTKHKGVVLRGTQQGAAIGTKNQYITHQDQFILSCIDARNGAFGIVPPELEGAIITNDFWCFDINEQLVLRDFFYTLIQAPDFDDACKKASIGTTNRQRINADFFLNYELEIPPIEEQADAVRQILAAQQHTGLIEAELIHQANLLTRMRQAILREAVQGHLLDQDPTDEPASTLLARIRTEKQRLIKENKLRAEKPLPPLSDADIPYEVPQGWAWCRLGELIESLRNGVSEAPNASSGTAILRISSLRPNAVNINDVRFLPNAIDKYESCILDENDLLFTRYSGNSDFVGICGVVPALTTPTVYPDKLMRAKLLDQLSPEFIAFAVNTGSSRAFIADLLKTTAGQVGVAGSQLKNTPIPLPPIAEQRRIVAKVTELLGYCTDLEAELGRARAAASALRAAALREAFAPVSVMVAAG